MTATYRATWPIEDPDAHLSDLHATATDDLADMLEVESLMVDGPITFHVEGDPMHLVATCPVRAIHAQRRYVTSDTGHAAMAQRNTDLGIVGAAARSRQQAQLNRDAILDALDAHPHWSPWEIARFTGLSERTVERHLAEQAAA